jgi:hypothetical protein
MNSLETPINYTKVVREPMVFTGYQVVFSDLVLHKEVTLNIHLYGESSHYVLHTICRKIEGEEYQQWGDDDSYIESIIQSELQKLSQIGLCEINK